MRRIMVFDRFDTPLFELAEGDVFELTRTEQVNGEHALTITTTRQLEQGNRILLQDDRSVWREYVVYGVDALHDAGERPIGTYYCTWSVQPDLMGTRVSRMPGTETPVAAGVALDAVLSGTSRWVRGTVTRTATGGASMYDTDGWDAMSTLVETWGGEVSTTIEIGSTGVTARKVDLYDKMGDQAAKRRFDFGADLSSIRRTIADGPLYCRITPRGKGEQTDTGGYGRKITIESVNGGKDYLEKASMVDLAKLPDGSGGWEYPTLEIENGDMETPAELKAWAQSVLDDYTLPRITYEVDVLQLAREGIDMQGVSLGDAVHIVDRKFGEGLRLSGRVVAMTVDELSGKTSQLTIGYIDNGLTGMFDSLGRQVSRVTEVVQQMNGGTLSTADYLSRLLDRINTEINATGGYTYITEGQGIRTYDTAVSDPLVGSEANAVVEVKGGTVRIANSRTAQGAWEWKTVFTSGHIAANLVTAANLTAGYIGNASGSYWDLDNDILQIASTAGVGDRTVLEVLAGLYESISNVTYEYAQNQSTVNPPSGGWSTTLPTWRSGYRIWKRVATTYGTGDSAYTVRGEPSLIPLNGSAGISSTTRQYYLSTSNTSQEGGSWSTTQPTWQPNRFIWVRLQVNWDNSTTTTTTPELAVTANAMMDAVNDAASAAANAAKTATNFLTFNASDGLDIGYSDSSAKTRINGSGMEIFGGSGMSAAYFGIDSGSNSYARIGTQEEEQGNVEIEVGDTPDSMNINLNRGTETLAAISYGRVHKYGVSSIWRGTFFTFGTRDGDGSYYPGSSSFVTGESNVARGERSFAGGRSNKVYGESGFAYGSYNIVDAGSAIGSNLHANGGYLACGSYNVYNNSTLRQFARFIVGGGDSSSSSNAMVVYNDGDTVISGTLTQSSDRRLKDHIEYLSDDAVEFVRELKPALFAMKSNGKRRLGFYAQDIQTAEPDGWMTDTVSEEAMSDEMPDLLTLDYSALIAPLVAYAQSLERRIEQLEARLDETGGAE